MVQADTDTTADIEKIQEDIEDLLSGLVEKIKTQIENLNKQNSELSIKCKNLGIEITRLQSEVEQLGKENVQLSKTNQRLVDAEKTAKRNLFDLRQKIQDALKGLDVVTDNILIDQSRSISSIKLDIVLVSDDDEVKRANPIMESLGKEFPDIRWKLLLIPTDKKSLQHVDLIIYCPQLVKNHKNTSWIDSQANIHDITIIRPQGGGTQIQCEIQKFLDHLSR